MATVQAENYADLVATTLKDLGRFKVTDLTTDLQEMYAVPQLMNKSRVTKDSGVGIQFNVIVAPEVNFSTSAPLDVDQTAITDGQVQASTVWRNTKTSWALVRQWVAMNRSASKIVDLVKSNRHRAYVGMYEGFENLFWGAPSATDTKTPYGLPYAVTKGTVKGFTGDTLSGFSNKYGLTKTSYPRWANWVGPYTNVTKDDFGRQAREARAKTNFKSPVNMVETHNTGDNYGYYTNYATRQPIEELLESQNDNLGSDFAPMDGKAMFGRRPINYVPALDKDTTGVFYGINWGWFHTYVLKDFWMTETVINQAPGQHNVMLYFLDCTFQWVCTNIREQFVLSTAATYPS